MKDGPEGDSFVSALQLVEVGTNTEGDPITSCVVVPVEGSAIQSARGASRLTPRDELAKQALANLLCDAHTRPACVPNGGPAIKHDSWRAECYRKGFAADANPEARKKAFQRMSEKLQQQRIIGRYDEWVWLSCGTAERVDKPGQIIVG
jgi:hypothetical protein